MKLVIGHKSFPNKIRVVRLLAVLSCKSNAVHVDFGLTTENSFFLFWDNSKLTIENGQFEL